MHSEWGRIDAATAERLNQARRGGRLIAVGTTAAPARAPRTRTASAAIRRRHVDLHHARLPVQGTDGLITNFHLPRSTLFMLVSALMGLDVMKAAYAHAVGQGYRFYSYGDSSLLLPER